MKTTFSVVVLSAATLFATQASAQDLSGFAGVMATLTEGYAQTFGEAVVNGQSVFVTAHGQAKLPEPQAGSYFVDVDGRSASAVEAARIRETKLAQLRSIAQTFGTEMEVGESRFSLGTDTEAQQRRTREIVAERAAHPGTPIIVPPVGEAQKIFVARTGVRFKAPPAARLPEFLDAVRGTGVDDIRTSPINPVLSMFNLTQPSETLGFGSVETVDSKVWDAASADAVRNAREQAQALTGPAGRAVGEARQILMLSRSVQNGEAVVTIGVRFGFAPRT